MSHKIYWIKRKDHVDFMLEGYIGYSVDVHRRYNEHRISKTLVGNNIRKYENQIEVIVLAVFESEVDALNEEKRLRPKKRIGWNIAIGGQIPPNNKDNISVREKISNTLKMMGANPYSEKTHSKESIAKAIETRKKQNRKMYHDPISGEYKFIAVGLGELIPDGWIPGRVKRNKVKKIRGVDYICNTKEFTIISPLGQKYTVKNLKQWCVDMNIPYLACCKKKQWKGWKIL